MTPMNLGNIHTTGNRWRWRSILVATPKFDLLTIRWYNATRKHLFQYPQGDKSGLRKPKKDKDQH